MSRSMRAVEESKKPAGTKDEYEFHCESSEKVWNYLQAPRTLPATWPATAPKQQVIGQAYKKHVKELDFNNEDFVKTIRWL